MKLLLSLLLFFLSSPLICTAQKPPKYLTRVTEEGTLYFIREQKMPATKEAIHKWVMRYDITHLSKIDSVIMTLSFYTDSIQSFKEVCIKSGSFHIVRNLQTLYVEPRKRRFLNRLQFDISYEDFKQMYENEIPYALNFGVGMSFSYKSNQWKKISCGMQELIKIMNMNKS